jgi:transcriptional regulator with XRE-family HTH domain
MPATKSLDFDAERVRRLRVSLGETQAVFAQRIGVSQNQLVKYEKGQVSPKRANIIKALLEAEAAA